MYKGGRWVIDNVNATIMKGLHKLRVYQLDLRVSDTTHYKRIEEIHVVCKYANVCYNIEEKKIK